MKCFHRRKDELFSRNGEPEHYLSLAPDDAVCFAENDAALKFRVNETLEQMIEDACAFLDISASDFIRQALFIHLYGRYRLLAMIERRPEFLRDRDAGLVLSQTLPLPDSEGSTRPRNVADFKVWLPSQMKGDLQQLADAAEAPLSRYVRNVVALHLTGQVEAARAAAKAPRKRQRKTK